MLQPGDKAPDFELVDADGTNVRLADLLAAGPVLLFFYPVDFSPACTAQACMMRNRLDDLAAVGVQVVGISSQGPRSHRRFAHRLQLTYPLLADPGGAVAKTWGARALAGLIPRRVSFLIDGEGFVVDALAADLRVGRHRRFVDRTLQWAQRRLAAS